jgi:hypothetical protein
MYKVTIQATSVQRIDWKVVGSGSWNPGQQPQLEDQILSAEVLAGLFSVTPAPTDNSGRNQVQFGDTLYAVVFRKLSRYPVTQH